MTDQIKSFYENYDEEPVYYEGGLRKPYKIIVAAGSFVAKCAA